jgi:hypothetical protein
MYAKGIRQAFDRCFSFVTLVSFVFHSWFSYLERWTLHFLFACDVQDQTFEFAGGLDSQSI